MALPRINNPTYSLELPSTGETIKYRPFLVKEQKILMMAQDTKLDADVADAMGKLVSSCTFGSVDPAKAPMFDIEYVFLKIRSKSVGSKIDLNITCPDDEKTQVSHTVDLDEIKVNMLDGHGTEIKINDTISLKFRYPILLDMANLQSDISTVDKVFHILNKCIVSIQFGDDIYQRVDITDEELNNFIDELTSDQFESVVEFFNTMPKLRHVIEVTNPKTNKKSEVVLEGLESFLE